jgi:hypothetical protein
MVMDFVPNYDIAKKELKMNIFGTYSKAYTVTNEDLRQSMQFMPKKCDDALVVAASGDHPLFCSLYGAKHVDTFDVSYNAKCMMDIKTEALNCLEYSEYISFLRDLYNISIPFADITNMDKILYKLPKTEYDYIYEFKDENIFMRKSISLNNAVLPTQSEYDKLRENIKTNYNFILTDVCKIKLIKSYDFIHLSNVFDYVNSFHYESVVSELMEHVRPGGRILTQFFSESNDEIFGLIMKKMLKQHKNWVFDKKFVMSSDKFDYLKNGIYVFEHTR